MIISNNKIEDIFNDTLKSNGYLFPETDDQMERCEEKLEYIDLPKGFQSSSSIIGQQKIKISCNMSFDDSSHNNSELAMAARDGNKILPKYILDKMKKDKENAKKDGAKKK